MPSFVNQAKEVEGVALNLIVEVKWEGPRPPAWKSMGTDVVAAAPADDLARLAGDAFAE